MASPQIRAMGTTYARKGQGPHLGRMRRTTRVFPGSGSVSRVLSLSSPNAPSRGLSRRRAGSGVGGLHHWRWHKIVSRERHRLFLIGGCPGNPPGLTGQTTKLQGPFLVSRLALPGTARGWLVGEVIGEGPEVLCGLGPGLGTAVTARHNAGLQPGEDGNRLLRRWPVPGRDVRRAGHPVRAGQQVTHRVQVKTASPVISTRSLLRKNATSPGV